MTQNVFFLSLTIFVSTMFFANIATAQQDGFRAVVINEAIRNMDAGIFASADPAAIKKYMPNGGAPASMSSFVLFAGDESVLIDAGLGGSHWVKGLTDLGVKPEKIKLILLTHMHGDHIGGLLRDGKKVFPKAEVYLSQAEYNYWTSESIRQALPENKRGGFLRAVEVMKAYKDKLHFFVPTETGKQLFPGLSAIEAYGHTPGHTAYLLDSDGSQLLIWGDLTHLTPIQIPCPQVAVTYDVDPTPAIASRKRILQYVASRKIRVAGMHIEYPGIGNVKGDADKGYSFTLICTCEGTVK